MPTEEPPVSLRQAVAGDLPGVADLHSRVREAAYPAMPRGFHDAEDVLGWVTSWDLATQQVWVALAGDRLAGYGRVSGDWLDDLYVEPSAQGTGIGSMLLDVVKAERPNGFSLWVFESNEPARAFYARRGLVELEHTDGSGNEERQPDLRMAWPGADPLAFFRRLIDEIDTELGNLLARRAALTRATQAHKRDSRRDPAREREIAETMATRAPDLGPDRLARIVQTIITESLDAAEER